MLTLSLAFTALLATTLAQDAPSSTNTATAAAASSTGTSQPAATTAAPNLSDAVTGILFLNDSQPATGFDASLLCADSGESTYVLGCAATGTPNELCRTLPRVSVRREGPIFLELDSYANHPTMQITVTAGPTSYNFAYSQAAGGARGLVTQSCSFEGPSVSATQAVCSLSGYIAVGGRSAQITSTIQTYGTGTDTFPPTATISITSGASNANASSCPATPTPTRSTLGNGANPGTTGMSANAAAPTGAVREVYKVLIPVGAAVVAYAGM